MSTSGLASSIYAHNVPLRTSSLTYRPISWYCSVCEAEMDIAVKDKHTLTPSHQAKVKAREVKLQSPAEEEGINRYSWQKDRQNMLQEDVEEEETEPDNPMYWKCTVCDITINIFYRDEHMYSKTHTKNLRKAAQEAAVPQPSASTWRCVDCEETMNVFYRNEHLAGKQHFKMLREKGVEADSACGSATNTRSTPYNRNADTGAASAEASSSHVNSDTPPPRPTHTKPAETPAEKTNDNFYCSTCAAEFPQSEYAPHLSSGYTCHICGKRLHLDFLEAHLQSHGPPAATVQPAAAKPESSDTTTSTTTSTTTTPTTAPPSPTVPRNPPPPIKPHPHDHTEPDHPEDSPPETFRCAVCSDHEFPLEMKRLHIGRAWECTTCKTTMHQESRNAHLASSKHKQQETEKPVAGAGEESRPGMFYCEVCERSFKASTQKSHVTWRKHREREAAKKIAQVEGEASAGQEDTPRVENPVDVEPAETSHGTLSEKNATLENQMAHPKNHRNRGQETILKAAENEAPIEVPKGAFYCEVCEKCFKLKWRGTHRSTAWECEICNMVTHSAWRRDHLGGRKHATAQERKRIDMEAVEEVQEAIKEEAEEEGKEEVEEEIKEEIISSPTATIAPEGSAMAQQADSPGMPQHDIDTPDAPEETLPREDQTPEAPIATFYCVRCDRDVKLEYQAAHLTDNRYHRDEIYLKAAENPAQVEPPEGMFYCKLCERNFELKKQAKHRSKAWKCEVCNMVIHTAWKQSHISRSNHSRNLRHRERRGTEAPEEGKEVIPGPAAIKAPEDTTAAQQAGSPGVIQTNTQVGESPKDAFPSQDPNPEDPEATFYCVVCEKNVKLENQSMHLSNSKHIRQEKKLASTQVEAQPAAIPEGMFYCDICERNCYLEKRKSHTSRAWECGLCDMTTHITWRRGHESGGMHTKRQEEREKMQTKLKNQEQEEDIQAASAVVASHDISPTHPGWFYCGLCGGEFRNAVLNIHQSTAWECRWCDKVMHSAYRNGHERGSMHIKRGNEKMNRSWQSRE